VALLGMGLCD